MKVFGQIGPLPAATILETSLLLSQQQQQQRR